MIKDEAKVETETDKSSMVLLTNIESYKEMAKPHINQDKVVTPEEVTAKER